MQSNLPVHRASEIKCMHVIMLCAGDSFFKVTLQGSVHLPINLSERVPMSKIQRTCTSRRRLTWTIKTRLMSPSTSKLPHKHTAPYASHLQSRSSKIIYTHAHTSKAAEFNGAKASLAFFFSATIKGLWNGRLTCLTLMDYLDQIACSKGESIL